MALTDNLIAFYELESDGTDSHSTNNLTANNTPTFAAAKVNNGVDLEASSSQDLSIADNAAMSTGDIDFTICGWFNFETVANSVLVEKGNGTNFEYQLYYATGTGRFRWYVENGASTVDLPANQVGADATSATWYFIVAWHDAANNTVGIRVNNGTADTTSYSSGAADTNGAFRIGSQAGASLYFDGLGDQVGFWKRVLTDQEQSDLYNGGSGLTYAAMSGGGGGGGSVAFRSGLMLLGVGGC